MSEDDWSACVLCGDVLVGDLDLDTGVCGRCIEDDGGWVPTEPKYEELRYLSNRHNAVLRAYNVLLGEHEELKQEKEWIVKEVGQADIISERDGWSSAGEYLCRGDSSLAGKLVRQSPTEKVK